MNYHKGSISYLSKYIHQLETNIENFSVPSLFVDKVRKKEEEQIVEETVEGEEEDVEEKSTEVPPPPCPDFAPFQQSREIDNPSVCLWSFMGKKELEKYLTLRSKTDMRFALEEKLGSKPKGIPRLILIEFMLDATIFCKNSKFGLEHSSAILGMYYLTHKYFTDHLYLCPEDVLDYFKQFVLHHSLLFPPTHVKLFNIEQCKGILLHFATLYLRHMPLIRLLTLPNFCFELDYELEPEINLEKKVQSILRNAYSVFSGFAIPSNNSRSIPLNCLEAAS
ncbi:hypothetical protein Trydic_g7824 [Trypoxylus dichotomus]